MATETFDFESYNKHKVDDEYNFALDNGTMVKQYEDSNSFTEIIIPPKPELFQIRKEYFKNGNLNTVIVYYKRRFVKSKREYDMSGKLIDDIDFDLPFKFTFEQLLELLESNDYKIDLSNDATFITRGIVEGRVLWEVEWKQNFGRRETLTIDGITGEILEQSFYPMLDN